MLKDKDLKAARETLTQYTPTTREDAEIKTLGIELVGSASHYKGRAEKYERWYKDMNAERTRLSAQIKHVQDRVKSEQPCWACAGRDRCTFSVGCAEFVYDESLFTVTEKEAD